MTPTTREKIRAALAQIIATVDHPHWGQYPLQGHPAIDIGREALALIDQEESVTALGAPADRPPSEPKEGGGPRSLADDSPYGPHDDGDDSTFGVSPPPSAGRASLADLRAAGWSVAVHNDYRQAGQRKTFWLFTHPNGRWIKGEGDTDKEAIVAAVTSLRASAPPEEGQPEWMEPMTRIEPLDDAFTYDAKRASDVPDEVFAQPEGMETTAEERDRWHRTACRHDRAEIDAGGLSRLLIDFERLENRLSAALTSSEADRAELTRCLDTQRKIEAENARLRGHLETIMATNDEFRRSLPADWASDPLNDACVATRAALAAENGGDA